MAVTLEIPHHNSHPEDIKRFGRSFGRAGICHISGCDYVLLYDEDVYEWFKECGMWNTGRVSTGYLYKNTLAKLEFTDPADAVLFKLAWMPAGTEASWSLTMST